MSRTITGRGTSMTFCAMLKFHGNQWNRSTVPSRLCIVSVHRISMKEVVKSDEVDPAMNLKPYPYANSNWTRNLCILVFPIFNGFNSIEAEKKTH